MTLNINIAVCFAGILYASIYATGVHTHVRQLFFQLSRVLAYYINTNLNTFI